MTASRGFTLIEILIVVAIIGVLASAFLPAIFISNEVGTCAAERANMSWHYQNIRQYVADRKRLPRGDGPRWVIDPWIRGVVAHNLENFERFFTPGRPGGDYESLRAEVIRDPHSIWRDLDEITSLDTDWAGPAESISGLRRLGDTTPLLATDNEGRQPTYSDGHINVLLGGGAIRKLQIDPDFLDYGHSVAEADTRPVLVGPDSPHPVLQQLLVR